MPKKKRRQGVSASDFAIVLGLALMVCSIGALAVDSMLTERARASAGRVISRVQPTLVPTIVPPPVEQPAPTLPPAPAAVSDQPLPETGGGQDNSFLVPGTPAPTPSPVPQALVPERILIPAIGLDAAVLPAGYQLVEINGQVFQQWDAPAEYAAGWQMTSAYLGAPGNTVLNGHHNIYGSVFGSLIYLEPGDQIEVRSGPWSVLYTVSNKVLLPERDEDLSVRLDNGRWMQTTDDERLTLVTCWPPESNTHRLFIVAQPVEKRVEAGAASP